MAHEISATDGFVFHSHPAWHGLGTVVADAPTAREALRLANIEWKVETVPVYCEDPTLHGALGAIVPGARAIRRADNKHVLGMATEAYTPVQQLELAEMLDSLAADGTLPKMESCGSLRGGRDIIMLAKMDSFGVGPGERDEQANYLLLHNSHDGTSSLSFLPTTIRVVCANTLRLAQSSGESLSFRHRSGIGERTKSARGAILRATGALEAYKKIASTLAVTEWSPSKRNEFFERVYTRAVGPIPTEGRGQTRAVNVIAEWSRNVYDPRQEGSNGTAWGALQAVTQWTNHERTIREGTDAVHGRLFGGASDFASEAYTLASEAVSVG